MLLAPEWQCHYKGDPPTLLTIMIQQGLSSQLMFCPLYVLFTKFSSKKTLEGLHPFLAANPQIYSSACAYAGSQSCA